MNLPPKVRIGLFSLLGAALVMLFFLGLARRERSPKVAVIRVTREDLDVSITSNGKVEPITPAVFRAQLPSFVDKVLVAEGQAVKRRQLLLTLDSVEARAQLAQTREALAASEERLRTAKAGGPADEGAQLEADLRKTEAELARLRSQHQSLERLLAKEASTQDELTQNQFTLERAEADRRLLQQRKEERVRRFRLDVERAQFQLDRAKSELLAWEEKVRSTEVRAPADGVVYSLPVHVGDFVRVGDLLAELGDLRRVQVRAFIDEPDLDLLEEGEEVEITWDAIPNRLWIARIERVPKQVVARGTRSVGEVLCSVANDDQALLPNINVNVRIRVKKRKGVLVVPRGAVQEEDTRHYVFLLVGDRLRRREIKVGLASAGKYEVTEGLAEGDRVALPGDGPLRDGLRVLVREQP